MESTEAGRPIEIVIKIRYEGQDRANVYALTGLEFDDTLHSAAERLREIARELEGCYERRI